MGLAKGIINSKFVQNRFVQSTPVQIFAAGALVVSAAFGVAYAAPPAWKALSDVVASANNKPASAKLPDPAPR